MGQHPKETRVISGEEGRDRGDTCPEKDQPHGGQPKTGTMWVLTPGKPQDEYGWCDHSTRLSSASPAVHCQVTPTRALELTKGCSQAAGESPQALLASLVGTQARPSTPLLSKSGARLAQSHLYTNKDGKPGPRGSSIPKLPSATVGVGAFRAAMKTEPRDV